MNKLAGESSLYLRQHADNPVDWYPWGEAALRAAREQDKPIFLSIGYSACHWCHVMAHESFEDPTVAAVLNDLFINIKVDREERPDLDRIYQQAFQLLNQRSGGWPLSVVLSPNDQIPFFCATYLPKSARHGMPAFPEIMRKVAQVYRDLHGDIEVQNVQLLNALNAGPGRVGVSGYSLGRGPLNAVGRELESRFDAANGGFGRVPKFPQPGVLQRLLSLAGAGDAGAADMLHRSLRAMADGGLYDQLGGGFFRYCVDADWTIPHFEKMLYDNAQLLVVYSRAWVLKPDPRYREVVEHTIEWLCREMRDAAGGYYATLDADSEGGEGAFYVWTRAGIEEVLSAEDAATACAVYGLDEPPNIDGHWHLNLRRGAPEHLETIRRGLLRARDARPRPARDEKILTAWNALLIKGLTVAGQAFQRDDWIQLACDAVDALHRRAWVDGRLLASFDGERTRFGPFLDDYAFLMDGLMALLTSRWRRRDFDWLLQLAEGLHQQFWDEHGKGGFYFTAHDHERLIQRPKPLFDDATPAGNGVAAACLIRLGRALGDLRSLVSAERTLKWAWPTVESQPLACAGFLEALEHYLAPGRTVILRGDADAMRQWTAALMAAAVDDLWLLAIASDAGELPPVLAGKTPIGSVPVTAYLCEGTHCREPMTELAAVMEAIRRA